VFIASNRKPTCSTVLIEPTFSYTRENNDTLAFYCERRCTGCANKKTIPEEKLIISVTVTDFFTKFTAFTEEVSGHTGSKYLLWFKNYHYLNLKVHFSKWTSN